jgi:hypothetical protein
MIRYLFLTLLILGFAASAMAQSSFSVPYTEQMRGGVQWGVDRANAPISAQNVIRAAEDPPLPLLNLITLRSFAVAECQAGWLSLAQQRAAERGNTANVAGRYLALDDAQKTQLEQLLDSFDQ